LNVSLQIIAVHTMIATIDYFLQHCRADVFLCTEKILKRPVSIPWRAAEPV
jgi:hypothetical protein